MNSRQSELIRTINKKVYHSRKKRHEGSHSKYIEINTKKMKQHMYVSNMGVFTYSRKKLLPTISVSLGGFYFYFYYRYSSWCIYVFSCYHKAYNGSKLQHKVFAVIEKKKYIV